MMLDGRLGSPCIMIAYGHASAGRVLRGRRATELLAGGGAARRHAARSEPADPLAREARRVAAARPVRPACRADRGGPTPVSERAAGAPPPRGIAPGPPRPPRRGA